MTFREFFDVYRGYRIPHFQLIEHRNRWFVFSGILIVLSLIGLFGVGLKYSIEFKGGAQISYPLRSTATVNDVTATLTTAGLADSQVQIVSGDTISVRTKSLTTLGDPQKQQQLLSDLAKQAGVSPSALNVQDIGPTWGSEISKKAIRGLVVVLLAIGVYIAFRFEWQMAAGAMIALVHDVVITAGIYALTQREVTPETVIAILTILGFSLYDTVVIYDKIKENTESPALVARLGYVGVVDRSLNQTIMRSVNTSLVVLIPVLSLLLFGGKTLKDFAFAMFVGVAIGAYSSIFIASPILVMFEGGSAQKQPVRGRPTPRVPAGSGGSAAPALAADAAATSATAKQSGSGSRPRPNQKKRPPAKRKRR
ncbi:MAG: protein translocase subunit SecF [Actinomycetota bacterium]